MAPGVVHVELHPVPGFLTEIDLQGVVVPVPDMVLVSSGLPRVIRIGLEEVDGIACARIPGARREVGATDHVAEVGRASCQRAGETACRTSIKVSDETTVGHEAIYV